MGIYRQLQPHANVACSHIPTNRQAYAYPPCIWQCATHSATC